MIRVLKNPIVAQLFKKFYVSRRFNPVFTAAHSWALSWTRSIQSIILFSKIGKIRPPFATTFQRVFIITYHSLHVSALIQAIIR
jgi:hypothetical protein